MATKKDPLFTTYAAPLTRSEFTIDEGYLLKFWEANNGINFETDTGGNLCLAFKLEDKVCYRLNQMYSEPVITTSYSDLVKYHYQPFAGIEVQVFFQVYSSRLTIEEVTITNTTGDSVALGVCPFLHHPRGIQGIEFSSAQRFFSFSHHEPPDGWTLGHEVPFVEHLANVYLFSEPVDAFGAYLDLGSLREPTGLQKAAAANYCVEWGTVRHADGSQCTHRPPEAQQIILLNNSARQILSEEAPKWGDRDPNIPGNGYQGCELGHFQNPAIASGDSFTVIFTCEATGQQGIGRGVVPQQLPAPEGVRVDVELSAAPFPPTPQNIAIHFAQDFSATEVLWQQQPGYVYDVFRRSGNYLGRYDLLKNSLHSGGYLDLGLNPDSTYGYIVLAEDAEGKMSGHSREVGNIMLRRSVLFTDILNPLLYNHIPEQECQVIAVQKTFALVPGESQSLRIIRGVNEAESPSEDLVSAAEELLYYDMTQASREDEELYARIPRLQFGNPEWEMTYWSAFSMMRQCMLPPEGQCSYNYNVYSREPTWGWGHAGQVFHENLSMLAYAFMQPNSAKASQWVFAERIGAQAEWPAGFVPYRVGPYLNEVNYLAGEHSSSAPWFNWENWEIFQISQDTTFLRQIYNYGVAFHDFWTTERDDDQDGLCEWGGHAFWESVRDYNVIWDLLGGWVDPHSANKVEALDLNCELVMEEKALANIAMTLGKIQEAAHWRQKAQARAELINALMWDPETRFYYHVEKGSHSFTYQSSNDLKRKELIGFLPLWAGVADAVQAKYLVDELNNPGSFGRPYGMPLLAHNDPYGGYDAHSVYPEWNFLVFRGLLDYGYQNEARQLAECLLSGVIQTLKDHHDFYESYYCDAPRPSDSWLHTYIWTGCVARMLIDLANLPVGIRSSNEPVQPIQFALLQNYPNPFNAETVISYKIPTRARVQLVVHNVYGQQLRTLVNEEKEPGFYQVQWDGKDAQSRPVASGIYLLCLQSGKSVQVRKMAVVR